jgi:hypothetical protein
MNATGNSAAAAKKCASTWLSTYLIAKNTDATPQPALASVKKSAR